MFFFLLLVICLTNAKCSELLSRHTRSWIINSFDLEEGHPGPFPYVLGKINIELDDLVYFDLHGEGVDEEPTGVLSIDKESGTVSVHRAVDYEENTMLMLKFEAKRTDLSTHTKLGVEISILDINDNPPRFQRDLFEISVDEETPQGSHLLAVVAYDKDQRGTPNSTFHYQIKSVAPNPPDMEFTIDEWGSISFKGCLDHEVADMFTVVVEAKDHGDVVSLSSSTVVVIHVEDGNNHHPTISGQTNAQMMNSLVFIIPLSDPGLLRCPVISEALGPRIVRPTMKAHEGSGKVREDETGTSPLRLHATDKDTRNSSAWRAKYALQGDEGGNFKIETDPDNNDGILTVIKPLDFEEETRRELTISVENEEPYFSCKVRGRTPSGLWEVDTRLGDDDLRPHSVKVIIEVEDANDPPLFSVTHKEAMLEENAPIGTRVETVTAVDPDSSHAKDFVYMVGDDPAGWVTVDPHTGDITTSKTPDRESPHVINGVYTILLHAVDNGEPPLTGTATLNIHVTDQNDNAPQLTVDHVDVCVSDGPTTTNITAFDPDQNPFGGPFLFELVDEINRKWKLNPSYGYTAGLVKDPGVYAGPHTIGLKISDMQGVFGVYNLSVTACDCSVTASCRSRQGPAIKAASGAVGVAFGSVFLFLSVLLMAVAMTCKKEFTTLQGADSPEATLLVSNIEQPGTDCKVVDSILVMATDETDHDIFKWKSLPNMMQHSKTSYETEQNFYKDFRSYRSTDISYLFNDNWNQTWNYLVANGHHDTYQKGNTFTINYLQKMNENQMEHAALRALLHGRLSSLQETEGDLLDYPPHLYADEGESDNVSELENIPIPDEDSLHKALTDLGPKFKPLASICKPPHIQN